MDHRHLYKRDADGGESVDNHLASDSELPYFDLELERLDFDHYAMFNTTSCSDAESSIYDCSLDDSFQKIKTDLELLQSPKKMVAGADCRTTTSYYEKQSAAAIEEDDFPEFDINARFDIMKNRLRNYRARETETIRHYIIQLNKTLAQITDGKGKKKNKNKKNKI